MQVQNNIKAEREFEFSENDFRFLSALAHGKTGIVLSENKKDLVYGRLARRLRALSLTSFGEYCSLLESDAGADEMSQLINAITTNLTSFFREGHHFEHLLENVIAPIEKSGAAKKLRIWSSAASSGMEPYSIAMTLKLALGKAVGWDAKILATDIDSNMINTGINGEYAVAEYERIPENYKQFVTIANGRVKVAEELKSFISFKQLNLLEAWPMKGPFDAIFCRNVMIYFDKETKQNLINRMADMLKPGGWLYIGHSENLHGISDRFELTGRTIYRRIK